MKIDFIELIKESFRFTWKYKILWVFGFIIALFSGGSNFNSSDFGSDRGSTGRNPDMSFVNDRISQDLSNFVNSPAFPIVIIVLILVLLALAFLGWYLTQNSTISLINAVKHDNNGEKEKIAFGSLWKEANSYFFWRIALFTLLWGLAVFSIILILFLPVVVIAIATMGLGFVLICCSVLLLIPILILATMVEATAYNLVVYYNYGIRDSLSEAWRLVKKEWQNYLLAFLFGLLPNIAFGIVIFIAAMILIIPSVLLFIAFMSAVESVAILVTVAVIGAILIAIILAAIAAPTYVFNITYWTKFINKIK